MNFEKICHKNRGQERFFASFYEKMIEKMIRVNNS